MLVHRSLRTLGNLDRHMGALMEQTLKETSQQSQIMPVVLAALVAASGFLLPATGVLYVHGYVAAMIFALATPVAYLVVAPKGLLSMSRSYFWLFIATIFFALAAAATSGLLLSMGSLEGAAGDIGGYPLWLLATGALITVTALAIPARRMAHAGPPTTLFELQAKNPEQGESATLLGMQRRERRERR